MSPISYYESLSPSHMDTSYIPMASFATFPALVSVRGFPTFFSNSAILMSVSLSIYTVSTETLSCPINLLFGLALLSFHSGAPSELLQKMPWFMLPR